VVASLAVLDLGQFRLKACQLIRRARDLVTQTGQPCRLAPITVSMCIRKRPGLPRLSGSWRLPGCFGPSGPNCADLEDGYALSWRALLWTVNQRAKVTHLGGL